MQYPSDPPRAEEIILVMRQAGNARHGLRIRALIAVLWRGGLRISEAPALNETDLDERRGALLVRHGKGAKRREASPLETAAQPALQTRATSPEPEACVLRPRWRRRFDGGAEITCHEGMHFEVRPAHVVPRDAEFLEGRHETLVAESLLGFA